MKRLNYRIAATTLFATLALNALLAWGVSRFSENAAYGILAWVVGWGVDLPGMLLLVLCACFGQNFIWLSDARSSDLISLAAIALFSGLTWSVLVGYFFRKKIADPDGQRTTRGM